MGCVSSRIDKEEKVSICKERKKLMKQLLIHRKEFADAQLGYLRALRNTGATLSQFTASVSLEPENVLFEPALPPFPPPPLPPSPPSPPSFSPDSRKFEGHLPVEDSCEKVIEIDDGSGNTPTPPPGSSSPWEFWEHFGSLLPQYDKMSETMEQEDETMDQAEEENWAETHSEFVEEDEGEFVKENEEGECVEQDEKCEILEEDEDGEIVEQDEEGTETIVNVISEMRQPIKLSDNSSSTKSWNTKDTEAISMILCRSRITLARVVRELDDYFLEASASGKDAAVLMDLNLGKNVLCRSKERKRKRCNPREVFGGLTRSWSCKSLQSKRDSTENSSLLGQGKPGVHCITLEKIYAEEQKLYKLVKEEETAKVEHKRKSILLQQQEKGNQEWTKTEKTRSMVQSLESDMLSLRQSISRTCSTILKLINEELHPQMIALTSGLMSMWQTMYGCHQVQNYISQQLTHLTEEQNVNPTTQYQRQAAAQLKTEITSWYDNFCKLVKAQRDYMKAICRWSQLTGCLVRESQRSTGPSSLYALSEEWIFALDTLPDKMASDAIKSLLSAVHSIILQQEEEVQQKRRSDKLEKKLRRESNSLAAMEMKYAGSFTSEDANSILSSKHPLSTKQNKVDLLKKQVSDEKAKYINSIKATQTMIFNNLQKNLPYVFGALMVFSSTYTQALEDVLSRARRTEHCEGQGDVRKFLIENTWISYWH